MKTNNSKPTIATLMKFFAILDYPDYIKFSKIELTVIHIA